MHKFLNERGIYSKVHIMDNEYLQIVRDYLINSKKIQLFLVPLYMHRVNVAEKAIDYYKNYFISSLVTVDPD